MANIDFTAALDQPIGQSQLPQPVPAGMYLGHIAGLAKTRPITRKDGKPQGIVTFTVELEEAGEDIDLDELEAAGGLLRGDGKPKTCRADFWQDLDTPAGWSWQLDAFIADFGIQDGSYTNAFHQMDGAPVVVTLKVRKDDKTGRDFNDVDRIWARKD